MSLCIVCRLTNPKCIDIHVGYQYVHFKLISHIYVIISFFNHLHIFLGEMIHHYLLRNTKGSISVSDCKYHEIRNSLSEMIVISAP